MGLFGKKNSSGRLFECTVKHITGLPIPEGVDCHVNLFPDKMEITAQGNTYNVHINQIMDVDFKMDVDTQPYVESNKALGVAGAMLFGVAGAVIASAPKNKETRNVTGCTIIHYLFANDNEGDLLFADPMPNALSAAKLCDKLKPLIKRHPSQTIDL